MYTLYHLIFDYTAWETQFNCSFIDVDSIPLQRRQKHWLVAYVTIVLCVIIYLLYIPCMYSLWKQQKDGNPCYRILLYCGVMDFGILWSLGILTPILALKGSVFCTDPLITFITGATNDFFYSCEMLASVLLALNRCMDILCSEITQMLFDGNKVWIWLGTITIYGLYWLICVNPSLFSSIYFAYFFNPFQGYIDADQYHPLTHTLHDWLIGGSVPVIYILFLIGIRWKMRGAVGGLGITRLQMMTFIQVFILCLIHLVGCSLYVLMQIIPVTESLIILAQFVWFINHGISPFIFLCINRTVRNDCILLFYKIYDPTRITQVHGITVLRSDGGGVLPHSGSQRSAAVTKVSPGILPPVAGNRERF